MPAKAGIQQVSLGAVDSRLRGNDIKRWRMTRRAGNASQIALNRRHREERSDVAIQSRRFALHPWIASLTLAMTKPFCKRLGCV
jgi:hypothetical protein